MVFIHIINDIYNNKGSCRKCQWDSKSTERCKAPAPSVNEVGLVSEVDSVNKVVKQLKLY